MKNESYVAKETNNIHGFNKGILNLNKSNF